MSDKKEVGKDPHGEAVPQVAVGDPVHWFPDGRVGSPPQGAFVTAIGVSGMLCLNILDPSSYNFRIRDGVRHIKDPRARPAEFQENGAWDLAPAGKRLLDMEKKVAQLCVLLDPPAATVKK